MFICIHLEIQNHFDMNLCVSYIRNTAIKFILYTIFLFIINLSVCNSKNKSGKIKIDPIMFLLPYLSKIIIYYVSLTYFYNI